MFSAIDRFYAAKGKYPWMSSVDSDNAETRAAAAGSDFVALQGADTAAVDVGVDGENMLGNLSTGGTSEVKASFITRIINASQTNALYIYNEGASSSDATYACFLPKSASFREEAWQRCADGAGAANTLPGDFPAADACPAVACTAALLADNATACMICLP